MIFQSVTITIVGRLVGRIFHLGLGFMVWMNSTEIGPTVLGSYGTIMTTVRSTEHQHIICLCEHSVATSTIRFVCM